jgi:hypothetical protein
MKHSPRQRKQRALLLFAALVVLAATSRLIQADTGTCNGGSTTLPFTDVAASNGFFCSIAAAYFSGLTNGTSATTYGPAQPVPREQMAVFITRTLDQSLLRGSPRAAMQQWWTLAATDLLRPSDLGSATLPQDIVSDGADLWVTGYSSGTVSRVRASDGRLLQTWTGATNAQGIIAALGRIFIAAGTPTSGKVYVIDPETTPGAVTEFAPGIGFNPRQITFDGGFLWTTSTNGSISKIDGVTGSSSTYTTGFNQPNDILWDGKNLWVADFGDDLLKRVNSGNGAVIESTPAGNGPIKLLFDGTNIWVSNYLSSSIMVVRAVGALRGTVLHTINNNTIPLFGPSGMAFDGERVMVCNDSGHAVTLFKAEDFRFLGNLSTEANSGPRSACGDGVNFWIVRTGPADIVRF